MKLAERWVRTVAVLGILAPAGAPVRGQDRFARPAPKTEYTLQKNVMIPMRDGVQLAADLYLPKSAAGRFPVIGSIGPHLA